MCNQDKKSEIPLENKFILNMKSLLIELNGIFNSTN